MSETGESPRAEHKVADVSIEPEPSEGAEPITVKKKRVLSEKQLANLAKAREKARVVNKERSERHRKIKADERKVKELRIKNKEDKLAAELQVMETDKPQAEPAPAPAKAKPKKKKKRVVYYSSSSSESEVEYVRKPASKRKPRREPDPVMTQQPSGANGLSQTEIEERALEHQYQEKLRKMKRQMIMNSVFPQG